MNKIFVSIKKEKKWKKFLLANKKLIWKKDFFDDCKEEKKSKKKEVKVFQWLAVECAFRKSSISHIQVFLFSAHRVEGKSCKKKEI